MFEDHPEHGLAGLIYPGPHFFDRLFQAVVNRSKCRLLNNHRGNIQRLGGRIHLEVRLHPADFSTPDFRGLDHP